MQVITSIAEWRKIKNTLKGSLGFVPTMGALHQGHMSLVKKAKQENDFCLVSIFVNPLQFNDANDYENYPNTLASDKNLLEESGVDYLFLPDKAMMYPEREKFFLETEHSLAAILEGECRPGHFSGMLTVVLKLLTVAGASRAYFGEKDYQQYVLIRDMAEAFFVETEIIPCPTIREDSSLPYSSRNARLDQVGLALANDASQILHQTTTENIEETKSILAQRNIEVEYLAIADNRVFSAINIQGIRLIDNFALGE